MKKILLVLCASLMVFSGCQKDKSVDNGNNTTGTGNGNGSGSGSGSGNNTSAHVYYAHFNFGNYTVTLDYDNTAPQLTFMGNTFGGFAINNYAPSDTSLELRVNFDHAPTNEEVLALSGKTLYQKDQNNTTGACLFSTFTFGQTDNYEDWYMVETTSPAYYVTISSVTYVQRIDNPLFGSIDVYEVKGNGQLMFKKSSGTTQTALENLQIDMLMSRLVN